MKVKIKKHGAGVSAAILSLAILAGLTGCQSEQSSPAAPELSPQEQMIHRRAVEAAVWGMALEGTRGLLISARNDLGGDWNDVVYFSKPMESRHGFLTANNQTPYVVASLNTKDGPLVVEVPGASDKAKYFGSFVDAWDYPFTDVGPAGTDKGKGGKYLLLPPGYEGKVPEGYFVFRPNTYAVHAALRPVAEPGGTLADQVAYAKTLKVYRLSEASNPPPTRFIDAYPKKWDTLPKYDISFFHDLFDTINEEPVLERDLVMMAYGANIRTSPYGANIRTNCMILLSNNITDNLFGNDKRHTTFPSPRNCPGRLA